ncbi:MAG: aconitase X swivel domain-containing protein [Candidatus Nanopelagicales bacterium]
MSETPSSIPGWRVTSGTAAAPILKLDEPVSFWGGIGAKGDIIDVHHPQHGAIVTGRILVMRTGKGSSSGAYVLAELLREGLAPAGLILTEPDGIVATGALVAAELYDARMPIVVVSPADYDRIEDGIDASIAMDGDDVTIHLG